MSSWTDTNLPYYLGLGVAATSLTTLAVWKIMKNRAERKRAEKRRNYPANTVILHQIGRGPFAPSLSPYPLKLETYLRMAGIPYQNEHDFESSSKGKTPFITYNGEDVADSQFCIEYLNKKLGHDLNSHLSKKEKAIARAFLKMTEENLYWSIGIYRWIYNDDNYELMMSSMPGCPKFFLKGISKNLKKAAHGQGMGRHTCEEVTAIMLGDLTALSDFLGNKKFLMGDKPSEVDCAIFGMLAQLKWHFVNARPEKMFNDFPNLGAYCDRMKDEFWPDWDECNTAGGTKPTISFSDIGR